MNNFFKSIIICTLLAAPTLWAACPKGSESGKTIIFLDLNDNPKEIDSARKAACKRGESLIVMPNSGEAFSQDTLDQLLTGLEKSGVSVNSLILSGHDGGGQFGGTNGYVSKSMLNEVMQDHPKTQESVSSVLLLGCYTGVKQEIFDWKQILPKVNLIAGYEGQAPLGDKPAGHSYIEGVLAREKEMNEVKSEKELEKILKKGIKHISSISAAMYVQPKMCAPGTEHESGFYFRPLKGRDALQDLETQECIHENETNGPIMLEKFMAYYRGEKEIPKETHGSELREIYNYFREKGHCFEAKRKYPSADKVLFTLFFDGVKKNFAFFNKGPLDAGVIQLDKFKENFDDRFEQYIKGKESYGEVLEERLSNGTSNLGEEHTMIMNELQAIGSELFLKFGRYFNVFGQEDDLSDLSSEDLEKYNRMTGLLSYSALLGNVAFSMGADQAAPFDTEILKNALDTNTKFLEKKDSYRDTLKEDLMKFEPVTQDFLENSSRAQILDKIHETTKMEGYEIFTQNVQVSRGLTLSMNTTLVQLECVPFEWHEFNEVSRQVSPFCDNMYGGAGGGGGGGADE